jgi:TldD protein
LKDKLLDTIEYLKSKGVDYADIRFVRTESEKIQVKNDSVESIARVVDQGIGIRVVADGAWGFAASSSVRASSFRKTANKAIQVAKASALTKKSNVRLADVEVYRDSYSTPVVKDPFKIRLDTKIKMLLKINEVLNKNPKVKTAEASMAFGKVNKIFVSTEGSEIEQDLVESGAGYVATASDGGETQRRSYPTSFGGDFGTGGYEIVESMNLLANAEMVREEAVALLTAPPMPAGQADIIIGGSQLALQIHESCGHPTELDRVLGTEISLAGGSFLTLDQLGKLKYGSGIVNIYADASIPGALGTFGYDDEGVKAQEFAIVKDGLFVGYLTSRETAPEINQRSNGTMRASGWNAIPLIRMTNINLRPGDTDLDSLMADTNGGYLLETNKSWSIDDKRLNFQFGQEIAWKIENGRKSQMYRNPLYTGMTPKFWNSCDAISDQTSWHVWGIPNCGKGEPMQIAHVAHGAAPARFRSVEVGVSK